MFKHALVGFSLITTIAYAEMPGQAGSDGLSFSIIKTAEVKTLEGMTYAGGSFLKTKTLNHMAVLVKHPEGNFLFDTGLGRQIDKQYDADMPYWARPFFSYDKLDPVLDQLQMADMQLPQRIILSHVHWDHASGLVDFPQAKIWVPVIEKQYAETANPPAVLPTQVSMNSINWHPFEFQAAPYLNYPSSFDLYGDGSAVLVPLPGHSPGSVGLFLTTHTGGRYFFVGDLVWNVKALDSLAPKFWVASKIVDDDREGTAKAIAQVAETRQLIPDLVVVPAHDQAVHDTLAYFPQWVE